MTLQVLIPISSLALAILLTRRSDKKNYQLPELQLSIDKYPNAHAFLNPLSVDPVAQKITNAYEAMFKDLGSTLNNIGEENFTEYILTKAEENLKEVNLRYLTSLAVYSNKLIAWFNNEAYHAAPIALNLAHNAFLKSVNPSFQIDVTNRPLTLTEEDKVKKNHVCFRVPKRTKLSSAGRTSTLVPLVLQI